MIEAKNIVDTFSDPLIVLSEDLVVRDVNPAFYRVFGTKPAETDGKPLHQLANGCFEASELTRPLKNLVEQQTAFEQVEIEYSSPDGGEQVFRVTGRTLVGAERGPSRLLLVLRDVTEQRQLEAELRRHTARVERSNRDLQEFARVASHDLQEPLRMVSNYLQLLDRRYNEDLPEDAREFIEYAVDGAERMKALINGLLQYSRVGRKEGDFRMVTLDDLVDDVLDDLRRHVVEKNGTVSREPLPTTYGNPEQLRRVFQNLIENALVYSGDEPPQISISGRTEASGAAHVVVRDQGPGIPPDGQDKIFKLFQQLDPHGEGKKGSGMGLPICQRIAERHGGRMWVESTPGEGSAFHVTIHMTP